MWFDYNEKTDRRKLIQLKEQHASKCSPNETDTKYSKGFICRGNQLACGDGN